MLIVPPGRDGVGQALVAAVKEHDWDRPPPGLGALVGAADLSRLPSRAHYHRVVGCALQSLRHLPHAPAPVVAELAAIHRGGLKLHLLILAALREAGPALDAAGVPWMVVKGPVLSNTVYRRADLRLYGDLDVLVPGAAFHDAVRALEGAGFELQNRNWQLIRQQLACELALSNHRGITVDLHWHLVLDRPLRRQLRFPITEMIDRARVVDLRGMQVRTLDPTDSLLHLAAHACLDGGDRLVWLKDIEQTVLAGGVDWGALVERARSYNLALLAGTMLKRAATTLDVPVPRAAIAALIPSPWWRAALSAADRMFPPERSMGTGTGATLVSRATRHDVPTTVREVARGALDRARHVARTRTVGHHRPGAHPEDPTSWLFAAGTEADRDAFFSEVAQS